MWRESTVTKQAVNVVEVRVRWFDLADGPTLGFFAIGEIPKLVDAFRQESIYHGGDTDPQGEIMTQWVVEEDAVYFEIVYE